MQKKLFQVNFFFITIYLFRVFVNKIVQFEWNSFIYLSKKHTLFQKIIFFLAKKRKQPADDFKK